MLQVSGMRIYTSEEVEAVNGTDVRLKCTFESSSPIKPDDVVITWTFRPLKGGPRQSVSVCVSVSLQRKKKVRTNHKTSLIVSRSIRPLIQVREEPVSHLAPCGAFKTVSVCILVCWDIENRQRRSGRFGQVWAFIFLSLLEENVFTLQQQQQQQQQQRTQFDNF